MLRFCTFTLLAVLYLLPYQGNAATPEECAKHRIVQRVDPCLIIESGNGPHRKAYPINQLMCFDYVKKSGATGTVRFFAVRHFDPSNPATFQQQLEDKNNQVLGDAYWTGPQDYWCRGAHWFVEARWVVMCDEFGGIGYVHGDALEYARTHTWPPGKRPIVMGYAYAQGTQR